MKKIAFIFFLFSAIVCRAQQTTIHFDKPYYFAGEYIFYSFCNTGLPSDSVSVEVELINRQKVVESYFLTLHDQCGDGYFKLAYDTPSATYQMNISIYEQQTFLKKNILHAPITIYNDVELPNLIKLETTSHERSQRTNTSPNPFITTTSVRAKNSLAVALPQNLVHKIKRISVSVRDLNLYGDHQNTFYQERPKQELEKPIRGIPFRGSRELISEGKIKNHLLFIFNPENMMFNGTGVDQTTNQFNAEISPFYGKKQVSFLDYLGNDIRVTKRAEDFTPSLDRLLPVDSSILLHLKLYQEEKQINRIFRQVGVQISSDSTIASLKSIPAKFFIDVQDYDIRGTMVTLFKELSTSLKFRSIGQGDYEAKLLYERNGLTKFYTRPPLFIVNNSATYAGVFIAKIPLQDIKYIQIFNDYDSLQTLSPIALGGLVYLEMLDPNYVLPEEQCLPSLSVQGMQIPISLPVVSVAKEKQPSVANLLYWHPSVNFEGTTLELDVSAHDIKSLYLVEVVLHLNDGSFEKITQWLKTEM